MLNIFQILKQGTTFKEKVSQKKEKSRKSSAEQRPRK